MGIRTVFQRPRYCLHSQWKRQCEAERPERGLLETREPGRAAVKQHATPRKAESAVITQIRTGRIDLAAFLRVPGVESPACQCGCARETAAHAMARFPEMRHRIAEPPHPP